MQEAAPGTAPESTTRRPAPGRVRRARPSRRAGRPRSHAMAKAPADEGPLRRELIANVSHDLRTPLVSLRGYLELLASKGDALAGEQRAEYLAVALRQSDSLARLIDELFELARLDTAGLSVQREAFAPLDFAGDVLQKFQPQADRQGVRLRLEPAADLPFALGDIGLVERALDNLIVNALKHTPAGGCVQVALRAGPRRLEFEVSDTGCGIPADELPHVFERSFRGSGPGRAVKGAGLGLAIAQRIAELHGGRITVASRPGEGTRFAFALPLA